MLAFPSTGLPKRFLRDATVPEFVRLAVRYKEGSTAKEILAMIRSWRPKVVPGDVYTALSRDKKHLRCEKKDKVYIYWSIGQ